MDAGTSARPRRRDAAATRAALLVAARALMAEHGVEGAGTRDVAAAAGVNQALVYRYFGSKEKLFAEAASGSTESDGIIANTPLADLPSVLLDRVLDLGEAHQSPDVATLVAAANDRRARRRPDRRAGHPGRTEASRAGRAHAAALPRHRFAAARDSRARSVHIGR